MKADNRVRVFIVDDERHAIIRLREVLIQDGRYEVVGTSTDPKHAVEDISKMEPDLVFLDIQMPGMDGFEVLKVLKESGVSPYVIFVTAYDQYTTDAITYAAFDYLLKPIDAKIFQNSLDRFYSLFEARQLPEDYPRLMEVMSQDNQVLFDIPGGHVKMPLKDILYIQADYNYARVYRSDEDFEALTMNLVAIEKMLPATQFVRINRSVIVNRKYWHTYKSFERKCILKKDGVAYTFSIPKSRIKHLEHFL